MGNNNNGNKGKESDIITKKGFLISLPGKKKENADSASSINLAKPQNEQNKNDKKNDGGSKQGFDKNRNNKNNNNKNRDDNKNDKNEKFAKNNKNKDKNKNKNFSNALDELLPQKMIPVIIQRSGIPPEEKCHTVTRVQRAALLDALKNFKVNISGFAPLSGAIVTAGGVSVKEVDPKTMQSKLVPGLFFAGEILDVDAYTGGFNLQIAFSTGHAAGVNL